MFMLALLGFIGATVLMNVSRRYNGNEKVQGWQEALPAAEAGADIALANLRLTVPNPPASPSPAPSPFVGWTKVSTSTNTTYTYTTPIFPQTGEGTTETWAVITVDSPIGDNMANPPAGLTDRYKNQWYRIRSVGHARVPGLARVTTDSLADPNARHTNALRKFSLRTDRTTGAALTVPEATRTIEVMVQPKTGFLPAVLADSKLEIKGDKTPIIDSFDSSDPTKSRTIGSLTGQYDPANFQKNGDVQSNGSDDKALKIDKNVKVYGDAATNGANFTDPNKTIQAPGQINNSAYTKLNVVKKPNWNFTGSGGVPKINTSVTSGTDDVTIQIDANSANNYYQLDKIEKTTTLQLKPGVTSGTVYIWLTDKMKGSLVIPPGVTAIMYFSGKTFHPKDDGSKNGIDNQNQNAANFQLYGVDPVKGNQKYDFKLTDTNFYGSIYAPSGNVKLKADSGSKFGTSFIGSFVADEITVQGDVHYDEYMRGLGEVIDYAKASYVEDPR